ncbi:MAG: TlpA family protein disulfide reductase [Candidatus Heimdallarchaeota archaeon]|nr:MAG: TlpA family protein disulfide reductase [Candidatus Heimdallarchaeota archaeon]
MVRRTIKVPKQNINDNLLSKEEEVDDVLTKSNSIHSKHHDTSPRGSSSFINKKVIIGSIFFLIVLLGTLSLGTQLIDTNTGSSINSLDFTIQLLDNSEVKLSDFSGEPIILDFMATYCSACKTLNEELKLFQTDYPDVHIISVSVYSRDSITQLKNYKDTYGISWTIGRDKDQEGATLFSVQLLPTVAFFDSYGILKHKNVGVVYYDTLVEWVNE